MDLGLQKIKTGANLWAIKTRIKNTREHILKTKPEATDYIKGAEQSEEELLEAISFLTNLYEHSVALSRENSTGKFVSLNLRTLKVLDEKALNPAYLLSER